MYTINVHTVHVGECNTESICTCCLGITIYHALCPGARVDVKDKERNTSLHIAARNGHASVVKTLTSYGADMMR